MDFVYVMLPISCTCHSQWAIGGQAKTLHQQKTKRIGRLQQAGNFAAPSWPTKKIYNDWKGHLRGLSNTCMCSGPRLCLSSPLRVFHWQLPSSSALRNLWLLSVAVDYRTQWATENYHDYYETPQPAAMAGEKQSSSKMHGGEHHLLLSYCRPQR